ncbi:unnamed protein product [Durusdinium trenchii]|uniref:Uncharacterized protein n=2 Tax=Durusdinium trenchii TaxID=1381693 RepID=A0ABP0IDC8_9DINO
MDWEPVREKLVAAVKDLSIGHPYVVIDGLLGGWAKALAEEADSLEFASKLLPHTFQFFAGGQQHFFKHPGRRYLDLDAARQEGQPTSLTSHAPRLMRFAVDMLPDLVASLRAAVPKLGLAETAPHVKLQLTTGEVGCTPCHYDTSYNDPTSLQLSILIYLSEGWCPEWGGELQLVPFLEPPVLLAPSFDRCVLFLADRRLHRSLPPRGPGVQKHRWLLTAWLDGTRVDAPLWNSSQLAPSLQRLLAPALHRELYLEALRQSLPPYALAREALLREQRQQIEELEKDETLMGLLEGLRELRAQAQAEDADDASKRRRTATEAVRSSAKLRHGPSSGAPNRSSASKCWCKLEFQTAKGLDEATW